MGLVGAEAMQRACAPLKGQPQCRSMALQEWMNQVAYFFFVFSKKARKPEFYRSYSFLTSKGWQLIQSFSNAAQINQNLLVTGMQLQSLEIETSAYYYEFI